MEKTELRFFKNEKKLGLTVFRKEKYLLAACSRRTRCKAHEILRVGVVTSKGICWHARESVSGPEDVVDDPPAATTRVLPYFSKLHYFFVRMGSGVEGGGIPFVALICVGLNSDGKGRDKINPKGSLENPWEDLAFRQPIDPACFRRTPERKFCSFSFLDDQRLVL